MNFLTHESQLGFSISFKDLVEKTKFEVCSGTYQSSDPCKPCYDGRAACVDPNQPYIHTNNAGFKTYYVGQQQVPYEVYVKAIHDLENKYNISAGILAPASQPIPGSQLLKDVPVEDIQSIAPSAPVEKIKTEHLIIAGLIGLLLFRK